MQRTVRPVWLVGEKRPLRESAKGRAAGNTAKHADIAGKIRFIKYCFLVETPLFQGSKTRGYWKCLISFKSGQRITAQHTPRFMCRAVLERRPQKAARPGLLLICLALPMLQAARIARGYGTARQTPIARQVISGRSGRVRLDCSVQPSC